MKQIYRWLALAAAVAVVSGCHGKQDASTELEKAAATLAKEEPAPALPETTAAGPASPPPAQQVQEALTDYKAGKMEDAVTRLQLLRNAPVLSPQQRMTLQDSIAAVMTEIYTLAEKGDPRAIAAVAQYERMQTGH